MRRLAIRFLPVFLALCLVLPLLPLRSTAEERFEHEYLEISDFDESTLEVDDPVIPWDQLKNVLNAHKVQEGSPVYKALVSINTVYASRLSSEQRSRPLLFLFEGCGSSSDPNLRLNALAVAIKDGEIVYYNPNCSTIPDYPFSPRKNGYTPMPTICSGIYTVTATNHISGKTSYAALQVEDAEVLRFRSKSSYYSSDSSGIHIHRRYLDTIPPWSYSWVNSCGCMLIGREGASASGEYARFLAAFGLIPSRWSGRSRFRYYVTGTVIVDRSQARSYLSAVGYSDEAIDLIGAEHINEEEPDAKGTGSSSF